MLQILDMEELKQVRNLIDDAIANFENEKFTEYLVSIYSAVAILHNKYEECLRWNENEWNC